MLSKEGGICFLAFHLNSPKSRCQPSIVTFLHFQLLTQQLYSIFSRSPAVVSQFQAPTSLLQFQVVSPQALRLFGRLSFGQDLALFCHVSMSISLAFPPCLSASIPPVCPWSGWEYGLSSISSFWVSGFHPRRSSSSFTCSQCMERWAVLSEHSRWFHSLDFTSQPDVFCVGREE